MEIWEATAQNPGQGWTVVTRRNVPGYPPHRVDDFKTQTEAEKHYNTMVVQTPRVSLKGKSPNPVPSLEEYKAWLTSENLFDPVLNPNAPKPK